MAGRGVNWWRAWTDDELTRLRELAGEVGVAEIARRLGRSEHAVRGQARGWGISLKVWGSVNRQRS
jgi:hypothetical protein